MRKAKGPGSPRGTKGKPTRRKTNRRVGVAASSVEGQPSQMRPSPTPVRTEWDPIRKCLVDAATGQPVPVVTEPVEPVRHAMPEGTPTRIGGFPPQLRTGAGYACDDRWMEAGSPRIGTPERARVFAECHTDFRYAISQRCWGCPFWRFHERRTPFDSDAERVAV